MKESIVLIRFLYLLLVNSVKCVSAPLSNTSSHVPSWLIRLKYHLPTSDCGIFRFTFLTSLSLLTAEVPLFSTHPLNKVKSDEVETTERLEHLLSMHSVFLIPLEALIASISSRDVEMHLDPSVLSFWRTHFLKHSMTHSNPYCFSSLLGYICIRSYQYYWKSYFSFLWVYTVSSTSYLSLCQLMCSICWKPILI